ncbi:hypothetical protein [Nakamurella endophytica]|uniref:Uncharacterized protein n=1 Tax=Nakamurella endophytica TaxID=1748367 RepID=A0A917W9D1_9ACTN|nr:hypothetical protein [Nakamurella endophytica]GGL84844.1 hypothetical protein GCM10011594_00530 [Nakamurella endophytica]
MRRLRAGVAAALAVLAAFVTLLLCAPAAVAGGTETVTPSGSGHPHHPGPPVALASTGLDITVPVVVGLSTLVAGLVLVAWAFLRRTPAHHRH